MIRTDIEFDSKGLTCRGWLYLPDEGTNLPGVVMAHGLSGVKEMDLPAFAERFSAAGFAVLLFDYRTFGASDGQPRGQLFPHRQIEDYRNAISFLQDQPRVDASCIGAWGTSFSGGHVLHLAAFDRRVKAVVSQVPTVSAYLNAQRIHHPEQLAAALDMLGRDRRERYRTGNVTRIPVVAPPGEACLIPGRGEYERLTRQSREVPGWENSVTSESFEKILEYAPAAGIRFVSPTPLLMIVAGHDTLTPPDLALDAFDQAREPKQLLWLPCAHHDVYDVASHFERAVGAATAWFVQHLGRGAARSAHA